MRRAGAALAAVLLLAAGPAAGSAQTKPQGRGIAILTTGYYWADADFDDAAYGTETEAFGGNGKFDKIAESLWFEYGYTDDLNFMFGMEFAHLRFRNDSAKDSNTGLGNPKFGAKWRFWNPADPTASMWALQGSIEPPLKAGGDPSLGYDDVEAELAIVASRRSEFLGVPFGVSGQLGYLFRGGRAADEYRASYSLSKGLRGWFLWAGLGGELSAGNQDNPPAATNPQHAPDFDRLTVSSFVSRQLTRNYWLQVGGAYDVAGRNTGQGKEVRIGIWYTF